MLFGLCKAALADRIQSAEDKTRNGRVVHKRAATLIVKIQHLLAIGRVLDRKPQVVIVERRRVRLAVRYGRRSNVVVYNFVVAATRASRSPMPTMSSSSTPGFPGFQ